MRHTSLLFSFLLPLGLCAFAGCGDDFDPYDRLKTLRVLAIKSEPAAPAPGETAVLSALTYAPPGHTVTHRWSWCPAEGPAGESYPCLVTEAQVSALLGVSVPSFDLGTAPEAPFVQSIPAEALVALCERSAQTNAALGNLAKFIDCDGGLAVGIKLIVRSEKDGVTTNEVISRRTLRLRFGAIPPNANPAIDGITVTAAGTPIDDTNSTMVTLPRNKKTLVGVITNADYAETYQGKDDDQRPAVVRERLIFSWFTETGDLKYARTSFIDGQVTLAEATKNEWKPELVKDYVRDTSKIYVVIRDERGGVGWRSGLVNLGGQP